MSTTKDLESARDLIARPYGWIKNTGKKAKKTPKGDEIIAYCVLGALAEASKTEITSTRVNRSAIIISAVVNEQYPEFALGYSGWAVPSTIVAVFNDSPERKKKDILAVMDKAIVRSQEQL